MNQATWSVVLSFGASGVKLLVQDDGDDVLKAQLPGNVGHPRALVTVLEGLALWSGSRVCAAAYVDEPGAGCFDRVFFGSGPAGPESPLVEFDVQAPRPCRRRYRRLSGVGDFRQLRLLEGGR